MVLEHDIILIQQSAQVESWASPFISEHLESLPAMQLRMRLALDMPLLDPLARLSSNALLLVLLLRVLPQPHKKHKNSSAFLYISYIFISCLTMLHDMSADVLS